jgi:hypothetical protein
VDSAVHVSGADGESDWDGVTVIDDANEDERWDEADTTSEEERCRDLLSTLVLVIEALANFDAIAVNDRVLQADDVEE